MTRRNAERALATPTRAWLLVLWVGLGLGLGACQSTDKSGSGKTGGEAPATTEAPDETEGDGRVLFETDPPGATMTLNGRVVGRTPVRVRMPDAPEARVGFRLAGYRSFAVMIEPDLIGWGTSYFYPMPPKIEIPPEVKAALEGKKKAAREASDKAGAKPETPKSGDGSGG